MKSRTVRTPGQKKATPQIGNDAVLARTGRSWEDWFKILDKAGPRIKNHKERAAYLHNDQKVSEWWCQMIAVRYEQERNLREVHQTASGYTASVSRTISVPVSRLFKAWADTTIRNRWLPGPPMTVRKMTPDRNIRIAWEGERSNMDVRFYAKGSDRSQVVVEHSRLEGARDVTKMKKYWKTRFDELAQILEPGAGSGKGL